MRAASLVKTPTDVPDPSLAGKSPSPSTVPASPILPGPAEAAAQSASSAAPQGSIPCAEDDEDTIRVHPPALKSPDLQSQPIRDLDRQIEALASEVDAFKIERKRLANFVQKKQQVRRFLNYDESVSNSCTQDGVQQADTGQFEKVLLIEEECIRSVFSCYGYSQVLIPRKDWRIPNDRHGLSLRHARSLQLRVKGSYKTRLIVFVG